MCLWSRCFLGFSLWALPSFWRSYILACGFLGRNFLGWGLRACSITFLAGTFAAAAAAAPLAASAFLGDTFRKASHVLKFPNFKLDNSDPHFFCIPDFVTIKMCHLAFSPLSGFNLLSLFRIDICLVKHTSGGHCVGT